MSGILQGTTPSLVITVPDDVALANITGLELTLAHKNTKTVLGASDVTIDTEDNTITYQFTEEQTLALDPKAMLVWQLRLRNSSGIVGTLPASIKVYDLISEDVMA